MAKRLRSVRLVAKPKEVFYIPGFTQTVRLTKEQSDSLFDLIAKFESGHELRPYYYRVNRDSSPDSLLEREGIMHLHLSPKDRDATLFLAQYDDRVVFLSLANHSAFRDDPPGSTLARLHENALTRFEAEIDAEVQARTAGSKAAVRRGLRPKPERND